MNARDRDAIGSPSVEVAVGHQGQETGEGYHQQSHAGPVEVRRAGVRLPRRQEQHRERNARHGERQGHEEHVTPAEIVDQPTAEHGSAGRPEYHSEAEDAHGRSAPMGGKHLEQDHHRGRHHQASAYALDDPRENELLAGGGESPQHGADGKDQHRADESVAHAEILDCPCRQQHGDRRRGDVARGEPLGLFRRHAERAHDTGDGDIDDRARQERREVADDGGDRGPPSVTRTVSSEQRPDVPGRVDVLRDGVWRLARWQSPPRPSCRASGPCRPARCRSAPSNVG